MHKTHEMEEASELATWHVLKGLTLYMPKLPKQDPTRSCSVAHLSVRSLLAFTSSCFISGNQESSQGSEAGGVVARSDAESQKI